MQHFILKKKKARDHLLDSNVDGKMIINGCYGNHRIGPAVSTKFEKFLEQLKSCKLANTWDTSGEKW